MHPLLRRLTRLRKFLLFDKLARDIEASLRLQILILLLFSLIILKFSISFYSVKIDDFVVFYDQKLRGFLFSGFLTVGSFLLSLKTFVVVNLKDKLFDSDAYLERYMNRHGFSSREEVPNNEYYRPLSNLTGFLFLSILFSIFTAVAQFSIGLIPNICLVVFCIWLALFTVMLLINSLRLIRRNLMVWLGYE